MSRNEDLISCDQSLDQYINRGGGKIIPVGSTLSFNVLEKSSSFIA